MLADFQARRRVLEDPHRRTTRFVAIWTAVGLLHAFFLWLLILSEWLPIDIVRVQKQQPMTWLSLLEPAKAPRVAPPKPNASQNTGYVNPTVMPKIIRPQGEENNAITDFGLALGRSLACGANSYEYLNGKMRAECKHRPWQFVYDRYGNIVLDARPRVPEADETLHPSDVQAHERNTAPVCPQNVDPNAPCLSAVIGGRR